MISFRFLILLKAQRFLHSFQVIRLTLHRLTLRRRAGPPSLDSLEVILRNNLHRLTFRRWAGPPSLDSLEVILWDQPIRLPQFPMPEAL